VTKRKQCICRLGSRRYLARYTRKCCPRSWWASYDCKWPYKSILGRVEEKKNESADVQLLSGDFESDIHTLDIGDIAECVGPDAMGTNNLISSKMTCIKKKKGSALKRKSSTMNYKR